MIYIDCTFTANHPHVPTGIPRVVRSIVNESLRRCNCVPIKFLTPDLAITVSNPLFYEKKNNGLFSGFVSYLKSYIFLGLRKITRSCPSFEVFLKKAIKEIKLRANGDEIEKSKLSRVKFCSGDIVVFPDAGWASQIVPNIASIKSKGGLVFTVFHDVIPLTHPKYCAESFCFEFKRWFSAAIKESDGYLTISKYSQFEIDRIAKDEHGVHLHSRCFYHGSDFCADSDCDFEIEEGFFLALSAQDPRKRSDLIFEAFKTYRQTNPEARLVFIGDQPAKIKYAGVKYLGAVTDMELKQLYKKCQSLIFASDVEGFGLPLIEARSLGAKVIASDIPVFREIADSEVIFFEPGNVQSLVERMSQVQMSNNFSSKMNWQTWSEATDKFIYQVLALRDEVLQSR